MDKKTKANVFQKSHPQILVMIALIRLLFLLLLFGTICATLLGGFN